MSERNESNISLFQHQRHPTLFQKILTLILLHMFSHIPVRELNTHDCSILTLVLYTAAWAKSFIYPLLNIFILSKNSLFGKRGKLPLTIHFNIFHYYSWWGFQYKMLWINHSVHHIDFWLGCLFSLGVSAIKRIDKLHFDCGYIKFD